MKPIRGGLLSVVGAVLALLVTAGISWAAFPGENGRIAYSGDSRYPPSADLFSVLPDGTSIERLTLTRELNEWVPAWSANGRRLAFERSVPSYYGGTQVFTMRADGSDQRQVTHVPDGAYAAKPYFSPSGRRIVYAVWPGRPSLDRIVKIRPDGAHRRLLVKGRNLTDPAYAPRGKRIVFAGAPKGRGRGIWSVDPDGSRLRRLTNTRTCCSGGYGHVADAAPDYSPDGSQIAFERCNDNEGMGEAQGECDLYLMRRDGSDERLIRDFDPGIVIAGLSYAPAGDRIAFSFYSLDSFDELDANVYTVTPSGTDLQQVTHNELGKSPVQPSWQPIPQP